jgi:hypothetical protein
LILSRGRDFATVLTPGLGHIQLPVKWDSYTGSKAVGMRSLSPKLFKLYLQAIGAMVRQRSNFAFLRLNIFNVQLVSLVFKTELRKFQRN